MLPAISHHGCTTAEKTRRKLWTDNETWKAYNVEAWPTFFLLDKQGRIRWMHVGEGNYDEAEQQIQKLLAEKES